VNGIIEKTNIIIMNDLSIEVSMNIDATMTANANRLISVEILIDLSDVNMTANANLLSSVEILIDLSDVNMTANANRLISVEILMDLSIDH
jgi:hypothetical protein